MSNSDFYTSSDDENEHPRRRVRAHTPPRRRKMSKGNCNMYEFLKPFFIGIIIYYFWGLLKSSVREDILYCNE